MKHFLWLFILIPLVCYGADSKITDLPDVGASSDDVMYVVDNPGLSTASDNKITLGNLLLFFATQDMTLTGTIDASGATITWPATITTTTFVGALTGNADTATALADNPTDCSANQFATTIAANGNLTCAALTDADIPNTLTISAITLADDSTLTLPAAAVDGGWTTGLLGFGPDGTGIFVNIADLEATIPISGEITDEQVACWESSETPGTNKLKSCGAKTTDNSTATHLLCKDDSNEMENCTLSGLAISGTTSPTITVTSAPAIPSGTNPTVDAAGEIAIDTDGANVTGDMTLRVYDGAATVAIGRKLHDIHVTVVKPQDLADAVRDAFLFWSNETGMTFTVTSIKCWAGTDDATLNVEETDADGQNNATVDAIECATNGTGVYTDAQTTITGATIEAGHLLWLDFDDTDDPSFVKITVSGWFNAAVD